MIPIDQEKAIELRPGAIKIVESEGTAGRRGDSYDIFTGDHAAAVQARPRQLQQRVKTPDKFRQSPESVIAQRRGLRTHWKSAEEAAEAMVRAAEADDRVSLGIGADDLDQSLAKLWDLRESRDLNWRAIVNHLQGMMRLFFEKKRAESLTAAQCQSIASVVRDYLGPATKSLDDLNEVVRLIEDAGYDPYAAISADTVDEEER